MEKKENQTSFGKCIHFFFCYELSHMGVLKVGEKGAFTKLKL